jgi:anti-sigma regulatory factor (Ser/Thr protein kinase)
MAQVSLRFPPSPDVVRTARLVAVATARRGWLTEDRLDEFRLAVGEICARAVRRCAAVPVSALGPDPRVLLEIEDDGGRLVVRVSDPSAATDAGAAAGVEAGPDAGDATVDEAVALALVRGLADSVELRPGPGGQGGVVVMTWNRE